MTFPNHLKNKHTYKTFDIYLKINSYQQVLQEIYTKNHKKYIDANILNQKIDHLHLIHRIPGFKI